MSSSRVNEFKLDIEDLNSLLESATRQRSKDLLTLEIRKLQTELIKVSAQAQQKTTTTTNNQQQQQPKCFDVKLNNYAWDQSDEFVKIYVTLGPGLQSLPKDSVLCNYTPRSMELKVSGLDNKNYRLTINNLCEDILPEKSHHRIKTDMVLVCLAKKLSNKSWSCVTGVEKRLKQSKEAAFDKTDFDDKNNDPSSSLINIMKKMYDEGDDKLKQTIAQAWTESQEKKLKGEFSTDGPALQPQDL